MAQEQTHSTIPEIWAASLAKFGAKPFLFSKRDGDWQGRSFNELELMIEEQVQVLKALGVTHGDRVATVSDNREEWVVVALAVYRLGAILVPMYTALDKKDRNHNLDDCRPKVLFVANDALGDEIFDAGVGQPDLKCIVSFEGKKWDFERPAQERAAQVPVKPEDVANIVYTSGTTGFPKGAMQQHSAIAFNVDVVTELDLVLPEDRSLAFLPLSHTFELTAFIARIKLGSPVYLCENVKGVMDDIATTQPTVICSVPNVFEKFMDKVREKSVASGRVATWLFVNGIKASNIRRDGTDSNAMTLASFLIYWLAYWQIFSKARKHLGGKLRAAIVGGARYKPEVQDFMDALQIPTYEGYGMTEACPIIAVNSPAKRRGATVGLPLPGVEVRIVHHPDYSDDPHEGEIWARGPNLMLGYYKQPEATAEALEGGWLHTGDLGKINDDGTLSLTGGRIKERVKLSNGKFLDIDGLERGVRTLPWVTNVVICGEGRPHPVALIVPKFDVLRSTLNGEAEGKTDEALLNDAAVTKALLTQVKQATDGNCKGYERIKGVVLLPEDFTVDNGLMTMTQKVKRLKVLKQYAEAIEKTYA